LLAGNTVRPVQSRHGVDNGETSFVNTVGVCGNLFQILLRKPNKLEKNSERKITEFDEKSKSILCSNNIFLAGTKRKPNNAPAVGVRSSWSRSR
jgi:hypothetical protein